MLGLVAKFSDLINDPRGEQSMIERIRYIKALEELVRVVKSHARIARPHVNAPFPVSFGITNY